MARTNDNTGGGAGVASLNTLTGTLTLAAGSGISITPSGGNTLTIASTGGSIAQPATQVVWGTGAGVSSSQNFTWTESTKYMIFGDVNNVNHSSKFLLDDFNQQVYIYNSGITKFVDTAGHGGIVADFPSRTVKIGDSTGAHNSTVLNVNDSSGFIIAQTNTGFVVDDSSGHQWMNVNVTSKDFAVGDISGTANGTVLTLVDSNQVLSFGALSTGNAFVVDMFNQNVVVGSAALPISTYVFGQGLSSASPVYTTIKNSDSTLIANNPGSSLVFQNGASTGNSPSPSMLWQITKPGAPGSALNTYQTVLEINGTTGGLSINGVYTMPLADGTNGQVMTTDGAGNVTFQNAGGSGTGFLHDGSFNMWTPLSGTGGSLAVGSFDNLLIGIATGTALSTGQTNMLIGPSAGFQITSGSNNVGIGFQAAEGVVAGSGNIYIGTSAQTTGDNSNSTAIGYLSNSGGFSGSIALGKSAVNTSDDQFIIPSTILHINMPLVAYANNAAAIAGGLAVGDQYYTNVAGDGIVKVVI